MKDKTKDKIEEIDVKMEFCAKDKISAPILKEGDDYDPISVVELLSSKKHPFYLIEIIADGFVVFGGNLASDKKEKDEKKHTGIGRKDKK